MQLKAVHQEGKQPSLELGHQTRDRRIEKNAPDQELEKEPTLSGLAKEMSSCKLSEKESDCSESAEDTLSSTSSDDSEWDWYKENDDDIYFVVVTRERIKKGQQIFHCYGRRTNKFLLSWYGFAYLPNIYDSYSFRVWLNQTPAKFDENSISKLVLSGHAKAISSIKSQNLQTKQQLKMNDLTKEFRLKINRINAQLIIYLRLILAQSSSDTNSLVKSVYSLPVSLEHEKLVLSLGMDIIHYLLKRYNTSIE